MVQEEQLDKFMFEESNKSSKWTTLSFLTFYFNHDK